MPVEKPKFFKTISSFHAWLKKNHSKETELWIGFYKKHTGKKSITYPEALDEALCFGWIDGVRKKQNEEIYKIRFSPRKTKSIWSQVNIKKVERLKKEGKMQPSGLKAYQSLDEERINKYSFEQESVKLDPNYKKKFTKKAWRFFDSQPPYYKKAATWWVMSAKKEETRSRRLNILISDSKNGERISLLKPNK